MSSAAAEITLTPRINFCYQNTHGHDLWHDYNPKQTASD